MKTEFKIPMLLPITLGQSTSTRPVQIYMDLGVSLVRFIYLAALTKKLHEM